MHARLPSWQQFVASVVVEHALDSGFCALPVTVSERGALGRTAKQCTCTLARVYHSRGDTLGTSCMRADSGEVECRILKCGGVWGYLNQRLQIECWGTGAGRGCHEGQYVRGL